MSRSTSRISLRKAKSKHSNPQLVFRDNDFNVLARSLSLSETTSNYNFPTRIYFAMASDDSLYKVLSDAHEEEKLQWHYIRRILSVLQVIEKYAERLKSSNDVAAEARRFGENHGGLIEYGFVVQHINVITTCIIDVVSDFTRGHKVRPHAIRIWTKLADFVNICMTQGFCIAAAKHGVKVKAPDLNKSSLTSSKSNTSALSRVLRPKSQSQIQSAQSYSQSKSYEDSDEKEEQPVAAEQGSSYTIHSDKNRHRSLGQRLMQKLRRKPSPNRQQQSNSAQCSPGERTPYDSSEDE